MRPLQQANLDNEGDLTDTMGGGSDDREGWSVAFANETTGESPLSDHFLSVLGHDLRNPLNAIAMSADLLLMRKTNRETADLAQRISTSARRMGRMIDQLADFARIRDGGGLQLARERVCLHRLNRQVIDELEAANPDAKISLEFDGTDAFGNWDADLLMQAVSNLGGNAIQHGAPGMAIQARVVARELSVWMFWHNAGIIPRPLMPVLFDAFHGNQTRGGKGLGLGLFITQQVVQAHAGTLSVISTPEAGTTFIVELPRSEMPA